MPKVSHRLLAIDPSTKALGWAVFTLAPNRLIESGVMRQRNDDGPDDEPAWLMNLDEVVEKVRCVCTEHGISLAVIEQPQMFGSSRGKAAAASGSILKLTAVAFALRERLMVLGVDVLMVPVSRWKGQTPKLITQKRVRRVWGWEGNDHNEADAVGIGDWYLRKGPGAG